MGRSRSLLLYYYYYYLPIRLLTIVSTRANKFVNVHVNVHLESAVWLHVGKSHMLVALAKEDGDGKREGGGRL